MEEKKWVEKEGKIKNNFFVCVWNGKRQESTTKTIFIKKMILGDCINQFNSVANNYAIITVIIIIITVTIMIITVIIIIIIIIIITIVIIIVHIIIINITNTIINIVTLMKPIKCYFFFIDITFTWQERSNGTFHCCWFNSQIWPL